MFEQFNKSFKKTVRDEINLESMKFTALKDFAGQTVKVDGFFFTESKKYGKQTVIVGNGAKINIPKRYTEDFLAIRDNDEMLKAVLDGHLTLTNIHEGDSSNGKTTYFTFTEV